MDKESIKVLEFIRGNPLCNSEGMDGFILKDLKGTGYIEAIDVTTDDSNGIPEFIEIRITSSGKNAISGYSDLANKAPEILSTWDNKPIGKVGISVAGIFIATCLIYLVSRYCGVSL
jgi:hypothetical protein